MDMLVKYLRKNGAQRHKKATLVAFISDEHEIIVGYSMCHNRDRFNRERGIELAVIRGNSLNQKASPTIPTNMPLMICKELPSFIIRASNYFKEFTLSGWANAFLKGHLYCGGVN